MQPWGAQRAARRRSVGAGSSASDRGTNCVCDYVCRCRWAPGGWVGGGGSPVRRWLWVVGWFGWVGGVAARRRLGESGSAAPFFTNQICPSTGLANLWGSCLGKSSFPKHTPRNRSGAFGRWSAIVGDGCRRKDRGPHCSGGCGCGGGANSPTKPAPARSSGAILLSWLCPWVGWPNAEQQQNIILWDPAGGFRRVDFRICMAEIRFQPN